MMLGIIEYLQDYVVSDLMKTLGYNLMTTRGCNLMLCDVQSSDSLLSQFLSTKMYVLLMRKYINPVLSGRDSEKLSQVSLKIAKFAKPKWMDGWVDGWMDKQS